ncbi:chemotaxis protein CheC [Paenibacillus protaetiae]|uniref:Chemotaxis protein CheC n=1 Tax=Paenibacillus protaetiae TaxID=2509456 RepID=A0A4P6EY96_9BACL|nr:chemotaxis protein CheC [Paenibacillus protaetiae]QAY65617.1 chemotaxis protein CheC [Paenibacillus protaetiae]
MSVFSRFEAFEFDVLREVGNIGAGHAATALSHLLNKPVDMSVPRASLLAFERIADYVGGPEQVVTAIYLRVEGDAPGNLFFIIDEHSANRMLCQLLGMEPVQGAFSELELSALCEVGNILAGSYLSSLADLTRLNMMPTVPSITMDMAGAILSYGVMLYGEMGDSALLIETSFLEGGESLDGHFFFIPDPESFTQIFEALGVPVS